MKYTKCLSTWLSTLGIATISFGSLVTMTQPALAGYNWVSGSNGSVPPGAIQSGSDNGVPLYACRANIGNGKLHPKYGKCYVPYGPREQEFTTYEVLVGDSMRWVPMTGSIPQNAVLAGYEPNGALLHVCRANLQSGSTPGKYSAISKVCYLPYGGKYTETRTFDILVSEVSTPTTQAQNYPAGVKFLLANNDAITKTITTAWNEVGRGIAQQKISEAIGGKVFSKGVSLYGQNVSLGDIQSRGVEFNPSTNQVILKVSAPGNTEFRTTTPTVFGSYGDPSFRVGFNLNATITISTATNKVAIDDVVVGVSNGSFRGSNAVGTIVESVGDYFTNGRFSQGIISKINGNYSIKNQLAGAVKSAIDRYVPASILSSNSTDTIKNSIRYIGILK
jgi:Protein of unknown function (DUF3421)